MPDLYVKTPVGMEEIAQRSRGLAQRQRRLLILIDGKKDSAALLATLPGEETQADLQQLLADGFIKVLEPELPKAPSAASVIAAAAKAAMQRAPRPESDAQRIEMARNFMLNTLNAFVGIAASSLISRVEGSSTIPTLQELYIDWRNAIGLSSDGRKRLQELEDRLAPLLS
jgi:hypothetical protein